MSNDYNAILGVAPNATDKEIRQAYRDLVRELQNARPDDSAAQERLNQVNEAFQVLSDPADRQQYDARRAASSAEPVDARATTPATTPRPRSQRGRWQGIIINAAVLIAGIAIGFIGRPFIMRQPTQQEALAQSVMAQTRHFKGNANAPVTIVEFGDFQ